MQPWAANLGLSVGTAVVVAWHAEAAGMQVELAFRQRQSWLLVAAEGCAMAILVRKGHRWCVRTVRGARMAELEAWGGDCDGWSASDASGGKELATRCCFAKRAAGHTSWLRRKDARTVAAGTTLLLVAAAMAGGGGCAAVALMSVPVVLLAREAAAARQLGLETVPRHLGALLGM